MISVSRQSFCLFGPRKLMPTDLINEFNFILSSVFYVNIESIGKLFESSTSRPSPSIKNE